MKRSLLSPRSLMFGLSVILIAGCADRNNNGQPDSVATDNQIKKSMETATKKMETAADKMKPAAQEAANKMEKAADKLKPAVEDAAKTAANAAEAGVTTPRVKLALQNEPGLRGAEINVDTIAAKNTVALRGSVLSAAQKPLAEKVAQAQAPGFKIVDQLTVAKGTLGKPAS